MKHLRISFVLFLFLGMFLLSNHAAAMDPDHLLKNLPKKWEGTFTWHDKARPVQPVTVTITDVSVDTKGNVIALGDGVYDKGHLVEFSLKWSIDTKTLRFEMWESAPKPSEGFVTDGSHLGKISEKLDKIEAVWTTISSGEQGDLLLKPKK